MKRKLLWVGFPMVMLVVALQLWAKKERATWQQDTQ
jgi:hypothetical protein